MAPLLVTPVILGLEENRDEYQRQFLQFTDLAFCTVLPRRVGLHVRLENVKLTLDFVPSSIVLL